MPNIAPWCDNCRENSQSYFSDVSEQQPANNVSQHKATSSFITFLSRTAPLIWLPTTDYWYNSNILQKFYGQNIEHQDNCHRFTILAQGYTFKIQYILCPYKLHYAIIISDRSDIPIVMLIHSNCHVYQLFEYLYKYWYQNNRGGA